MGKNCHKISRREGILVAFAVLASASLVSCRDWPDECSTTIEAQNILRDLGRIETIPDPNVQGPSIYKSPPKKIKQIVGGGEEWKLIYFCRCHTAEEMKQIINEQFATKLFDEKGKSANVNDYTVTANVATNQLIVRCPLEADIDAVMELIKEIDIPPIQVRIDCMVSELYADLTVDRETSMAIKNLFGEGITLGGQENNGDLAFPAPSSPSGAGQVRPESRRQPEPLQGPGRRPGLPRLHEDSHEPEPGNRQWRNRQDSVQAAPAVAADHRPERRLRRGPRAQHPDGVLRGDRLAGRSPPTCTPRATSAWKPRRRSPPT